MKPEAQRIAIAEACGWRRYGDPYPSFEQGKGDVQWWKKDGGTPEVTDLPNYPTDLNAMHEAEKTLDKNGVPSLFYGNELWAIVIRDSQQSNQAYERVPRATAAQRAEAFLRTIGKWEEST